MAVIHGKSQAYIIDGEDVSRFLNEGGFSCSKDTSETTTMGKNGKCYISGLKDGTLSMKGLYDPDVTGNSATLEAEYNTETKLNVLYAPGGLSFGSIAKIAEVDMTSLETSNPIADVVEVNGELQASGGIGHAKLLTNGVSVAVTGDGANLDGTASSDKGAIAHLHVTGITGTNTPSATVKIQHSADGSTAWADLVSFTAKTEKGSQRVEIAAGTTINRYTRAQYTIAGTNPSIELAVALYRKS